MSVWAELANRFRYLARRGRFDEELDQEICFHIETRAAELEALGFSPSDALAEARREFGSALRVRERAREVLQFRWFETLSADLRFALRMMARSPLFSTVAVLTLGLGIAANTAVFSVVYAVLLRALPFPDPQQLVQIYADLGAADLKNAGMSIFELEDLRDKSGIFSRVSPVSPENGDLSGLDRPERIEELVVSVDYFALLGATPALGRVFEPKDAARGFSEAAVISDGFWRRRFSADPHVIGRQLRLDNDLYTVIGVMPPNFHHPGRILQSDVDIWNAAGWVGAPFPTPRRDVRNIRGAIGRLRPDMTVGRAQAQLDAFVANQHSDFGLAVLLRTKLDPGSLKNAASRLFQSDRNLPVFAVRTMDEVIGTALAERRFAAELVGVFGVMALILAAVGMYGVMAYIVGQRTHEFGLRMALGAQSRDVLKLVLSEGLSLALIGLAAGSAGALALSRLLAATLLFGIKSYDPPTFSTVVLLLMGIAFLACWIPARRATRVDPMVALRCE